MTEDEFWLTVYNLNVAEFARHGGLPERWRDGRLFPVGKQEWDLVLDYLEQLRTDLGRCVVAVSSPHRMRKTR